MSASDSGAPLERKIFRELDSINTLLLTEQEPTPYALQWTTD